MNLTELLKNAAEKYSDRVALVDYDGARELTYAQLDKLTGHVAGKLNAMGYKRGDFICVCMNRCSEYIAALFGIYQAGCVAVPMIPEYPAERRDYIYAHCDAKFIITKEFFSDIESYSEFINPAEGSEPQLLVYTSGSTGTPKGILHSARNMHDMAIRQGELYDGIENINHAAMAMMTFLASVFEYQAVFLRGGTTHMLSETTRLSINLLEEYYIKHGITTGYIPPQMLKLFNPGVPSLKRIITGSERIVNTYFKEFETLSVYGMSELGVSGYFIIDKPYDNTPVGTPFTGIEYRVVDENGKEVPNGTEGEIYFLLNSDACYFKDPEKTAKTMLPQPDGRLAICSSDIGYKLPDDNLIFVNRKDWMVKINGQRVETQEIEVLMQGMPEIDNAVTKAFTDDDGQTYLCAYYVPVKDAPEDFDTAKIRRHLSKKLPDYMIPRHFVKLSALPKNTNGKLDRTALTPPKAEDFKAKYRAPENDIQKAICCGFEQVIHCEGIGLDDDFFHLGGDSIKVLRLIEATGLDGLTPDHVLRGRTPEIIAKNYAEGKETSIVHTENIPEVCPLTEAQRGVYLECIENPDSLMYNIPAIMKLPEGTDAKRFIAAVKKAASMHQAFNITCDVPGGIPSMIYHRTQIQVDEITAEDTQEVCRSFAKPFDLENGPLYRFTYVYHDGGDIFLFDVHHIIFDGSSVDAFVSQVAAVYDGGEVKPEALTIFDLALNEECEKTSEKYKKAQDYFREKLEGVNCDSRPYPDRLTEVPPESAGRLIVSPGYRFKTDEIRAFVRAHGITENVLFMAAFAYTLAKFNCTRDTFFTTAHHGRMDSRLSDSIGMFVRTLPVYCTFDEEAPLKDFLKKLYKDYYDTKENSCISFGELAAAYGVNDSITFIYQDELLNGAPMAGGHINVEMIDTKNLQVDMDVMMMKKGHSYELMAHYRRALYTGHFVKSFLNTFTLVIRGMLDCDRLADIPLVDAEERARIDLINKTEAPYEADKTTVDLFRRQASLTPDGICLVYKDKRYTYRQVDEITDNLAAYLKGLGMGPEKIAGVLIPRCEYMVIAAMGILKAGGAYMPMDPSYPPERLNLMMSDSAAALLITTPELSDIITDRPDVPRIMTDEIPSLPAAGKKLPAPAPDDLFVLLYTSGSTGTPKGVMYNHSNALVTCAWVKKYYGMNESTRFAQYASYGFDAHVYDFYSTLMSGGELHIIPEEIRLDFLALRDYFNENGITHTVMTMQIGRQFMMMKGLTLLKHISVAGEKMPPTEVPEGIKLYNAYGPSEGSVITSIFEVDRKYKDVPIGKAVDNVKLYVVDQNGKLLPLNAAGELWLAGPHVTRGYLNRPEKTAEAYGLNPFEDIPGYKRIYRTGDIVRMMGDGNMQFVGRRDAQVKIRGFRIELKEIEEVIMRYPGIKDVTVAAFDDPSGVKYLAAYLVSDEIIRTDALADFIRSEKPPYMVPSVFMQIDKIPLTQNQKVNVRALPVPEKKFEESVPPENEMQKKILDIISGITGQGGFGVNTDIFDAGLTSVGSVRLTVALSEEFNVSVKIADIKANETVKKLEQFINSAAPEQTFEKQSDYQVTQTQSGVFIDCMNNPGTVIYNMPALLRLGKNVDTKRLSEAIGRVMDAHPFIKTRLFADASGDIRAKRRDDDEIIVPVIKCTQLPDAAELIQPFTLIGSPLYHMAIYETAEGKFLFMDFHHIIGDGTSEEIIYNDIVKAYNGEAIACEKYTGFDVCADEQLSRTDGRYEKAKAYWDSLLAGCEPDCSPKKTPEGADGSGSVIFEGNEDIKAVNKYLQDHGLTMNAFINAAFAYALSRFTGKDTVSYATIHNGRSDSRFAGAVTMMVKTIPVLTEIKDDETVAGFVRNMQSQLLSGMSNDACSFAELSGTYGVKADILLAFQGEKVTFKPIGGEAVENVEMQLGVAKEPLSFNVNTTETGLRYAVDYRRDTYNRDFAFAFADALSETVKSFIRCEYLKDVTMMSPEAQDVYKVLNDSDMKTEPVNVAKMIESCAASIPDTPAVTSQDVTVTYKELNGRANTAAKRLIDLGVKADITVGVILERSIGIPMMDIAVMKAGGAFINILPDYPDDRIDFCLKDAGSPYVITTQAIKESRAALFTAEAPYKVLTVEELSEGGLSENPGVETAPESLAYCIYTSGSTGKPKGVMIEHRNLSNMIQTHGPLMKFFKNLCDGDTAMACCAVSFDASVLDTYMPLALGKHLVITTDEEYHNPAMLRAVMEKYGVKHFVATPAYLTNLVNIPEFAPVFSQLTSIIVGAEAFPVSLYEAFKKCAPDLQIFNGYGPSECTVMCSYKELKSTDITIGRASGNVKLYIIDKFGHILPPYAAGELLICGAGVGRGYINLPEKTAAAFGTFNGMKAYHSGDYVRLRADGDIDFCGRIDNQVKLRGFRVELDEIEKVMRTFNGVRQCKVLVRNNGSEDYLAGFFTADTRVDISQLSAHLNASLTYYMVPSVLMQLDKMPLTTNGKIDKNGFPEVTKTVTRSSGRRAAKKSLEQRLCEIFASVLGQEEIFADDNFFNLGGTSLTASKVTMLLMSENIEVKYGDIFDNPTPEQLAVFIETRDKTEDSIPQKEENPADQSRTRETLKYNTIKYADQVKRESLGNVLLTGAVGFLGIHILKELLDIETGHIYCLVRKGGHKTSEIRLRTMLIYYFSKGFDEELKDRITVVDADITDSSLDDALKDAKIDTVINCAACVKHFTDTDILEQINVHGVENLIRLCQNKEARLIQISTTSVPGIHTKESYENQVRMHENELFVIDDMDNKYGISKYQAELRVFDAIDAGLSAKVIRVGNLMGRHSDGEFQANFETNMFLSGIRGFATMGKYPISHMIDPMKFSPIDCTARAAVLLSGTNDMFTAFNCDNRYGFDEMKIVDACNACGITILPEADEVYYAEYNKKLGDESVNSRLGGLAAYDIKDAHAVDTDNRFTANILYRIGFSWPLVDDTYLQRAIESIMTLDYFGPEKTDEE